MLIIISVWAIVAVDLLHPQVVEVAAAGAFADCDRCVDALSKVYNADLTLFEMTVLGENWGSLAYPLLEENASWVIAGIILFGTYFSIVVGLMNLVMAVIVDFAVNARDEDSRLQSMLKEKLRRDARKKLMDLCVELDADQGGTLTLEEFLRAHDGSKQFRAIMELLDVDRDDLECVFRIMDKDRSGDVSYSEFTDLLYKMKAQNSRTLLLFIKYYTLEIRRTVTEELNLVRNTVATQLYKNASMVEQLMMAGTPSNVHSIVKTHRATVIL